MFIEAGKTKFLLFHPEAGRDGDTSSILLVSFGGGGTNGQLALIDSQGRVSIISRLGEETGRIDNIPQVLTHLYTIRQVVYGLHFRGGELVCLISEGRL